MFFFQMIFYRRWWQIDFGLHRSKAASTWWCGSRPRLGWVKMAVGFPEGLSYPGHYPHANLFSPCSSLNERKRAARNLSEIGRLFSFLPAFPIFFS